MPATGHCPCRLGCILRAVRDGQAGCEGGPTTGRAAMVGSCAVQPLVVDAREVMGWTCEHNGAAKTQLADDSQGRD